MELSLHDERRGAGQAQGEEREDVLPGADGQRSGELLSIFLRHARSNIQRIASLSPSEASYPVVLGRPSLIAAAEKETSTDLKTGVAVLVEGFISLSSQLQSE